MDCGAADEVNGNIQNGICNAPFPVISRPKSPADRPWVPVLVKSTRAEWRSPPVVGAGALMADESRVIIQQPQPPAPRRQIYCAPVPPVARAGFSDIPENCTI